MVFRSRRDGVRLDDVPALRRIIPYLMPTRTESLVYYPMRIEVDDLCAWLEEVNADRTEEERLSLFHVVLTSMARALRLRPEMNRFVAGRRTYQRSEISVSFIVKTEMTEAAPETEVRLLFTGHETPDQVRDLVDARVLQKRTDPSGADDRLVAFFASWPRPVLRLIARGVRTLDYHNALPAPLQDAIPLFTSIYLVNTGSIGINPPYHHLYEVGTASIFAAIGRVTPQPVVDERGDVVARSCLDVAFTLDERVSEGFYYARSLEVFARLVARPELLADPDVTVERILAGWPGG